MLTLATIAALTQESAGKIAPSNPDCDTPYDDMYNRLTTCYDKDTGLEKSQKCDRGETPTAWAPEIQFGNHPYQEEIANYMNAMSCFLDNNCQEVKVMTICETGSETSNSCWEEDTSNQPGAAGIPYVYKQFFYNSKDLRCKQSEVVPKSTLIGNGTEAHSESKFSKAFSDNVGIGTGVTLGAVAIGVGSYYATKKCRNTQNATTDIEMASVSSADINR